MGKTFYISGLLFLLLCPAWLAYFFFTWQKHEAREEAKRLLLAGMDAAELVTIQLSKAEAESLLHWEEEHEFEYQGQMYDVVDITEAGDSIRYLCYWDRPESRLHQQLENLLKRPANDDPVHTKNTERLLQFFQSLFCVEQSPWDSPVWRKGKRRFAFHCPDGLLFPAPLVPPPDL